jgi:restriction system protein
MAEMSPMDFTTTIIQAFAQAWWLFAIPAVLGVLFGLLALPAVKGYLGEFLVRVSARMLLDRENYVPLHNVTLRTRDGTTQVDHVIVSPYGVFVIETKNMRGWIFGGEKQSQWTQKIFRKTFRFQNPLRQNYKHVRAVEEALRIPAETAHSVVVFVGGATFKTPMPENVTRGVGYARYIKSFREPVFSEFDVRAFVSLLESGRLTPSAQTHRGHVAHLQKRADPTADHICPACGSAMVIRTVRRGDRAGQRFWGCSGYPKCRVTQEVG